MTGSHPVSIWSLRSPASASPSPAREKYGDGLKIGRFNMAASGKSLIAGDTDGLFKVIVAADTGEILGAHLYGQHVTDMIGEISRHGRRGHR